MSQSRESLLETFNSFDKDNSGYLDTDEVVQAAQQLGVEATKEEIQAVIFLIAHVFTMNRFSRTSIGTSMVRSHSRSLRPGGRWVKTTRWSRWSSWNLRGLVSSRKLALPPADTVASLKTNMEMKTPTTTTSDSKLVNLKRSQRVISAAPSTPNALAEPSKATQLDSMIWTTPSPPLSLKSNQPIPKPHVENSKRRLRKSKWWSNRSLKSLCCLNKLTFLMALMEIMSKLESSVVFQRL